MEKGAKAKDEGLCNGRGRSMEGVVAGANSRKETGRAKDLTLRGAKKQRRLILSDSESDEDLGGSGCFRICGKNRTSAVDGNASRIKGSGGIGDFEGTGPGKEVRREKYIVRKGKTDDGDEDSDDNCGDAEKVTGAYVRRSRKDGVEGGEGRTGGCAEYCEGNSFDGEIDGKDAFTDDESLDKEIVPASAHIVRDHSVDNKKNVGFPGIRERVKMEVLQLPDENVVGNYLREGNPVGRKRERDKGSAWLETQDIKLQSSNDNSIKSNANGVKVQFNSHRRAAAISAEKRIKSSDEVSVQVKSDETTTKPHFEENALGTPTAANGCKELEERTGSNNSSSSSDHIAPFYETLASRKARLCARSMGVECGRSGSSSINSKTLKRKTGGEGTGMSARGTQKTKAIEKDLCLKSSLKRKDEIHTVEVTKGTSKEGKDVVTRDLNVHPTGPPVINKGKKTGEPQKRGKTGQMQLVREKVKNMLLCAGWKIELRPRRGRDYEDLVYVSPSGSAYWSIPNAYRALKKELDSITEEGNLCMSSKLYEKNLEGKHTGYLCGEEDSRPSGLKSTDGSTFEHKIDTIKSLSTVQSLFSSFSKEELDILTRKRKKAVDDSPKKKKCKVKVGNIEKKNADRVKSTKNVVADKGHKVVKGSPVVHFVKVKQKKADKGAGASGTNSCDIRTSSSLERKGLTGKGIAAAIKSNGVDGKSSSDHDHEPHAPVGTSHKKSLKRQSFLIHASENPQGRKKKGKRNCTLMVRRSCKGENHGPDSDLIPYSGKQTIIAWLIDSGTLQLNWKAKYWNKKHTRVLMEGYITREGILCNCCGKTLSVAKFEIHAGSKLCQPYQNIFVESGMSLLECQLQAWNAQGESERSGMYVIQTDESDQNDDTCGICGDGGNLICCDSCPSTFHLNCLGLQALPPGLWHCPHCSCRFCEKTGDFSSGYSVTVKQMKTCLQCEAKYHTDCGDEDSLVADLDSQIRSFCGNDCRKLFEQLKDLVGVKHDLDGGFSWTIVQRDGVPQCKLAERVECNSKVAVALSIMDECFMPIVDRRTSANLIHNIVYNCGSNFNRVNYSGFYTLLLEKGDEVISVASIRIHGTRLAEMPLIGTRYIYRRQGMCRRLITALESVLCRLNVKMLIIPAIADLLSTWTTVFGFKPLEESHIKDLRKMNLMVFPGTDLLQKAILGNGIISDDSENKLDDLQHAEDCLLENINTISIKDTVSCSHFCRGKNPTSEPNNETLVDDPAVIVSEVITERAEVAAEPSLLTTKETSFGFTAANVSFNMNNSRSSEASDADAHIYTENEGMTVGSFLVESKVAAPEPCSDPVSMGSSAFSSDAAVGLPKAAITSFDSPNDNTIQGSVLIEDASDSCRDARCKSCAVQDRHAMSGSRAYD
ncbi:unnamed protein product [Victoria cruziana]